MIGPRACEGLPALAQPSQLRRGGRKPYDRRGAAGQSASQPMGVLTAENSDPSVYTSVRRRAKTGASCSPRAAIPTPYACLGPQIPPVQPTTRFPARLAVRKRGQYSTGLIRWPLCTMNQITDAHQEIRTLLLPLVELRRTARRHGCQPIQGLRPRPAVHQIRQRQIRRTCPTRRSPSPRAPASRTWSRSRASPTSATRSTRRSSPRWPMPTSCPTCPTSTTPPSSAAARRWWTGSPTSSPSSRTRRSISRRTAPRATTSWAMPTNTSCGTSPPRAARARASSTRPPRSAASWRRSSASATRRPQPPPPSTTPPAAPARCC